MRNRLVSRGAFLCCSVFALVAPALAQERSSDQAVAEIIVTAQRRAESLQKVPMTVNVATGDQIQKLNIFDFKDVAQLAPGLELTNNDGRSNTATLRGITYSPDSGTTPAVEVYFNDIPADPQTVFTAIYDVNQIEVLRGPQGIFRGRTSPAGAITISTRKPNLDKPEGYLQLTGTTRDTFNGQGAASLPLVPGKIGLRAAAMVDTNKSNQVRNVNLDGRQSSQKTISGRLSLAFQPTETINAVLTYQHLWSDTRPFIAVFGPGAAPLGDFGNPTRSGPALDIDDRAAVSDGIPRFTNRTHLLTLETDVDLSDDIVWSTNAGYQDTLLKQRRDLDAFNTVPGVQLIQKVDIPYIVYNLDTRLSSQGSGFFNWMFGGYYGKRTSKVKVSQQSDVFGFIPAFPPFVPNPSVIQVPVTALIDLPVHEDAWALFGSARFNFTDRLRLEAGLRYTHLWLRSQNFLSVCAPACTAPAPGLSDDAADYKKSVLTGGASLSYDWTSDFTTYVSYGRASRPRTVTVGATYSDLPENLLISDTETSDSIELGFKSSFLDRRINLNVSAFYQKYKNYIDHVDSLFVRTTDPVSGAAIIASIPTNSNGDAISKGIEAQLIGRISRDFDVGLNASYVDAHYDNAELPCNITDANGPVIPVGQTYATCLRNDRVAQVPKFSASINGEYRFHMGNVSPFIRGLANFRPGFTSVRDNYRYRSFTNVNLFVGVRGPDDRWEISAFSKNLLNQARALNLVYSGQQGQQSLTDFGFGTGPGALFSGYRGATISLPREFGVTARFNW